LKVPLQSLIYGREKLTNQVHDLRAIAKKHQTDTETLNRQLTDEQEASYPLEAIFDEWEEA
jgi:hypothetical protein